ncbi:MAG: FAD-dependent oxidoreductase, partial [Pseudomonadota bacterium]
MTPMPLPLTRDLVLIGGGHTHALVLKRWGMSPVPGVRLTVINPAPTAPYTGMLPGFVAGHYTRDALEIDLVKLARFAGARLIFGYADGIDLSAKRIHITDRGEIAYDIASIDVGITTAMPDLPGFAEYGVPAKPLGVFADRWSAYLGASGKAQIAVIGAGVGGAELAMAMSHALARRGRETE